MKKLKIMASLLPLYSIEVVSESAYMHSRSSYLSMTGCISEVLLSHMVYLVAVIILLVALYIPYRVIRSKA